MTVGVGTYNVRVNLPIVANANLTETTLSGCASVSGYGEPNNFGNAYIAPAVANDLLDATVRRRFSSHHDLMLDGYRRMSS